jgi:hypothetical protein
LKRAPLIGGALLLVLGTAAGVYYVLPGLSRSRAPSAAELARLVKERDQLRDEFGALLAQQGVLDFAEVPAGNVLVGMPKAISERLVSQVVTGLLSEVRVHLTNLHAHTEDDVQARVLFKERTVGHFTVDVDIKDVRAVLKPGDPDLEFGQDRIGIRLPVHLAEGRARGNVRFRWDGQGLAGAVCGDLDVSPDVSSRLRPATYTVKGDFLLSARGDTVVADPDFPPIVIDVRLDPGPATWKVLADTVQDVKDDKNGVCRMAIQKIDVQGIVRKIIDKGFNVKLPRKLFRPIALPAAVEQSVEFQGKVVSLNARPIGLRVTPKVLWYGVAFGTEVQGAVSPSPPASPAPRPTR